MIENATNLISYDVVRRNLALKKPAMTAAPSMNTKKRRKSSMYPA